MLDFPCPPHLSLKKTVELVCQRLKSRTQTPWSLRSAGHIWLLRNTTEAGDIPLRRNLSQEFYIFIPAIRICFATREHFFPHPTDTESRVLRVLRGKAKRFLWRVTLPHHRNTRDVSLPAPGSGTEWPTCHTSPGEQSTQRHVTRPKG